MRHGWLGIEVLIVLVLVGGCQTDPAPSPLPPETLSEGEIKSTPPETVSLALSFVQGRKTLYTLLQENSKQVQWFGVPKEKASQLRDAITRTTIHLGFSQEVANVNPDGTATLAITVTELAVRREVVNKRQVDFDSRRPEHAGDPLMVLIGKGYKVNQSTIGEVNAVTGHEAIQVGIDPRSSAGLMARQLFSEAAIRKRHTISPLAQNPQPQRHGGDTWREPTVANFDEMGTKAFHKIYTLSEMGSPASDYQAVIRFTSEPSSPKPAPGDSSSGSTDQDNPFESRMDSEMHYSGHLKLDRGRGEPAEMKEDLRVVWRLAGISKETPGAEPVRTVMTARRLYQLDRVNED